MILVIGRIINRLGTSTSWANKFLAVGAYCLIWNFYFVGLKRFFAKFQLNITKYTKSFKENRLFVKLVATYCYRRLWLDSKSIEALLRSSYFYISKHKALIKLQRPIPFCECTLVKFSLSHFPKTTLNGLVKTEFSYQDSESVEGF